MVGQVVVQVREGNLVLRPDGLPNDDLVDVVELVPVFVPMKREFKRIGQWSFLSAICFPNSKTLTTLTE